MGTNMITWTLEPKEADYIMQVLMQRPFAEVQELINKLVKQANSKAVPIDTTTHQQAGS